jgi:3-isopropylmalate/(R)-2-methylmalate dehydratase large subunit
MRGDIMGMTMTQKILAKACGMESVKVGEIHEINVDLVMVTDVMFPLVPDILEKMQCEKPYSPEDVLVVIDHYAPAPNISSANQNKYTREYAKKYGFNVIENQGVCHTILPDMGYVSPGSVILGSDSHTVTYGALGAFSSGLGTTDITAAIATGHLWMKIPSAIKVVLTGKPGDNIQGKDVILNVLGRIGAEGARYKSIEVTGEGLSHLGIDDRFTMANMSIEGGAKNCVIEQDEITREYLKGVIKEEFEFVTADDDAEYDEVIEVNLSEMVPQVAKPSSPDNVVAASEVAGTRIDQVYIGSCTNGRISDLRKAAKILEGKKIHEDVRLFITPGSQEVYMKAVEEGLMKIFIDAGAFVNGPSCGACFGGHFGIIGDEEVCLSTTNRNFVGRMGSKKGLVYLASPITAAASALTGVITEY